jgi:hypothetical protein
MFGEKQTEYGECLLTFVSKYSLPISHLKSHTHAQNNNFIFEIEEDESGRACSIHKGYKKST